MRSRTIRAVAVVKDLFFVARFRETARLNGAEIVFARTPAELRAAVEQPTDVLLLDLAAPGLDYDAFFAELEARASRPPVLGITTHALARHTQPLHARCARVVTRETLTQELGTILKEGIPA
jgi:CheY-like chemotaxis protein